MKILNLYDFISSVEHRKLFLRMFTLLFPIQQKQEPGTGLQRPKKLENYVICPKLFFGIRTLEI